jgi:GNAT superfamily N-acetyltransferase
MALVPWTEEQRKAFVKMQFAAQHQHYRQQYPDGDFMIILDRDRPVGRLYVTRLEDQIRIMDITVLPEERGRGVGTSMMRELMDEAAKAGKPLRINVESFNRSLRLFERLGFSPLEVDGFYVLMEYRADT